MRPFPIPTSLALTMLLGTAAAQESVTVQKLLVRCRGGIDLQVDPTAWMAMLHDADLRPLLTAEQAAWVNRCTLRCGPHLPDAAGGHQIEIHTGSPRDLAPDQQKAIAKHAVRLIEQRLNAVFHNPHRDQLEQDLQIARQTWQNYNSSLTEAVVEPLEGMAQSLQTRHDRLREQQSEVRIALATEARARDYVRERLVAQEKERQDLEQRYLVASDRKNALQREAEAVRASLPPPSPSGHAPDSVIKQHERVRELEASGAQFDRDLQRLQRDFEQNFRQSSFFYEQLPTVELALLRAEAREQVLADEGKRLEMERAEFQARLKKFAEQRLQADMKRFEMRALEQRLGELQSKRAELQPVRVDVISSR